MKNESKKTEHLDSKTKIAVSTKSNIIRRRNVFPILIVIVVTLLVSPTIGSQFISAQRDAGLRVIVHILSEPFDRTFVEITDDDGDGSDSRIVTTRSDGTRNVEFLVPPGAISVNEPFYVYAESDSGLCDSQSGENSPAKKPEHVYLILGNCDIP